MAQTLTKLVTAAYRDPDLEAIQEHLAQSKRGDEEVLVQNVFSYTDMNEGYDVPHILAGKMGALFMSNECLRITIGNEGVLVTKSSHSGVARVVSPSGVLYENVSVIGYWDSLFKGYQKDLAGLNSQAAEFLETPRGMNEPLSKFQELCLPGLALLEQYGFHENSQGIYVPKEEN